MDTQTDPNLITDSASELSSALFQNYLSLVHYNVQSLLPKIDIIESELTYYDSLCFTETWLSPNALTLPIGSCSLHTG